MTAPTTIRFELAHPIPLLNKVLRMHWATRRKYMDDLSWEVRVAVRPLPTEPMTRARVTIERHSTGVPPDPDAAIPKALLDVLQPHSKRHPFGLGIIANDSADCIELLPVRCVRVQHRIEQKTVVVIEDITRERTEALLAEAERLHVAAVEGAA